MKYSLNELKIDGHKARTLAHKYSTPLYCYSLKKIKININNFKKHFKKIDPLICFSVKSNSNKILLKEIGKLGLGADVVSVGELVRALNLNKPNKIVFSRVGKTKNEINFAVKKRY